MSAGIMVRYDFQTAPARLYRIKPKARRLSHEHLKTSYAQCELSHFDRCEMSGFF